MISVKTGIIDVIHKMAVVRSMIYLDRRTLLQVGGLIYSYRRTGGARHQERSLISLVGVGTLS